MSYDTPYSCLYRTQEDTYFRQYSGSMDDPDTQIVMERSVDELLECERDAVQLMMAELE